MLRRRRAIGRKCEPVPIEEKQGKLARGSPLEICMDPQRGQKTATSPDGLLSVFSTIFNTQKRNMIASHESNGAGHGIKRSLAEMGEGQTGPAPVLRRTTTGSNAISPSGDFPKISRKIRACKACQSRKVKCDITETGTQCARCRRLGLQCVINKNLQTLLEDENEWKITVEQKLQQLQHAVSEILRNSSLPGLEQYEPKDYRLPSESVVPSIGDVLSRSSDLSKDTDIRVQFASPSSARDASSKRVSLPGMAMTRENSQEPDREEAEGNTLVSAPMASLFEVTKLRNLRSYTGNNRHNRSPGTTIENDFISQGLVSKTQAEELFRIFSGPLNQYLWGGIALVHNSLDGVRRSSSLLLAAILAVTALHVPGNERVFDVAYSEFLALVSASMFDRYHSLDDVRALAIGAFWLSDVSWKLSGHAVRIATELQLHLSFYKAIEGHHDHVEKGRLWAFLYVCDHHFSIAYGRPPVIHEDFAITNHEEFLKLPGITNADYRLHSQVSMFVILSRIYNTFGPDSTKPLNTEGLKLLPLYNSQFDEWKMKWEPLLASNPHINTYPAKGVLLHHQFGKLQLNSLALRGMAPSTLCGTSPESSERRMFANAAVQNAIEALSIVLEEPDMRRALVGVPIYLLTTITFATVFLLKVRLNWHSACLNVDSILILDLVGRIVDLLSDAQASDRHLARHIAKGLRNLVNRFKERDRPAPEPASDSMQRHISIPAAPPDATNDFQPMEAQMAWPQGQMDFGAMWGDFDAWGMDENYLPMGMFNTLANQIPG